MIKVCSVVGYVQLAVSVNKCKVTVTVQTANTTGTYGYQVTVIYIID